MIIYLPFPIYPRNFCLIYTMGHRYCQSLLFSKLAQIWTHSNKPLHFYFLLLGFRQTSNGVYISRRFSGLSKNDRQACSNPGSFCWRASVHWFGRSDYGRDLRMAWHWTASHCLRAKRTLQPWRTQWFWLQRGLRRPFLRWRFKDEWCWMQ